jgi:hypothetical protein
MRTQKMIMLIVAAVFFMEQKMLRGIRDRAERTASD